MSLIESLQEEILETIESPLPIIKVDLNSTAIRSATYIKAGQLMILEMHDGKVLEYPETELSTFNALVSAPSPGSYYNAHIRLGFHSAQRA